MKMVGPTEIILLVLIAAGILFAAWSFRYVIRKSWEIRQIDPNAFSVWQVVVMHVFIVSGISIVR